MNAPIQPSVQLMMAAANALVGLGEPSADARLHAITRGGGLGVLLDAAFTGDSHRNWDTALVQHIGYWAHFDMASRKSAWPLPTVSTPDELSQIASRHHINRNEPRVGDIFLQYGTGKKLYVRAGLVAHVVGSGSYDRAARASWRYYDIVAIEGATELDGRLGGKHVVRLQRRLVPDRGDRFVRWFELDGAQAAILAIGAPAIAPEEREQRAAA